MHKYVSCEPISKAAVPLIQEIKYLNMVFFTTQDNLIYIYTIPANDSDKISNFQNEKPYSQCTVYMI